MTRTTLTTVLASITLLAGAARTAAADEGDAHRHDGLFVQLQPGFGVAATSAKMPDGSTLSMYGPGATFGIAIGAALSDHWIIAADLSGSSVFGPRLKKDDMTVETNNDVNWSSGYLGVSTAYYVMPLNLRVGGGIGAFRMALDVPNMDIARSRFGGAAKLGIGKEWWVSDRWGLGLGLEAVAGAVPDSDTDKGWGFFSVGLGLSATYN
jgi:uncharacterized RDD family membrane protein YckC